MDFLYLTTSAIMGACFGSFATMASYRIPRREDIVVKRSHCTKCNKEIKALSLIPTLSWIFQGGKCSNCHTKISIRYPLIEIITSILFVISYLNFGISINTIIVDIVITSLIIFITIILEGSNSKKL
jgi:prepilin signal peptidase PulO-like enzyme (type II secretory pathway)